MVSQQISVGSTSPIRHWAREMMATDSVQIRDGSATRDDSGGDKIMPRASRLQERECEIAASERVNLERERGEEEGITIAVLVEEAEGLLELGDLVVGRR
ncbi:hypothetical protein ABZP36_000964 [Zizania latifolia]